MSADHCSFVIVFTRLDYAGTIVNRLPKIGPTINDEQNLHLRCAATKVLYTASADGPSRASWIIISTLCKISFASVHGESNSALVGYLVCAMIGDVLLRIGF